MFAGNLMETDRLNYELPEELIAQRPADKREGSRLMVLHRHDGTIEHRTFPDITEYFNAGDLLVCNDSRVLPARLSASRATGGRVDILLLSEILDGCWTAMLSPGRRLKEGELLTLSEGRDVVRVGEMRDGFRQILFEQGADALDVMNRLGRAPLPPYIRRKTDDPDVTAADLERYQTVYARAPGSVAAPTAGLHFTDRILANLRRAGVGVTFVTLHVGVGTFRPVEVENPADHTMHSEISRIPSGTAEAVNRCRTVGGKVWAVGTTVVRTLESGAGEDGRVRPSTGKTRLFIRPPYRFRVVDHLITNFHLPRSTLLMLVGAFAGYHRMREAYDVAIGEGYRFYSYGDAMVIL